MFCKASISTGGKVQSEKLAVAVCSAEALVLAATCKHTQTLCQNSSCSTTRQTPATLASCGCYLTHALIHGSIYTCIHAQTEKSSQMHATHTSVVCSSPSLFLSLAPTHRHTERHWHLHRAGKKHNVFPLGDLFCTLPQLNAGVQDFYTQMWYIYAFGR